MANPSNVGGSDSNTIDYGPENCEATGTAQTFTLNPHCTYAIKHNGVDAAGSPAAVTAGIHLTFSTTATPTTATVTTAAGTNNLYLGSGESVGGIGPGLRSVSFIGGAASISFTIWPSASRFGNF
jgi:hypothetical protein